MVLLSNDVFSSHRSNLPSEMIYVQIEVTSFSNHFVWPRFFLTMLYVHVCALLTMRASSEKKERDSMYIRLTTTKLLFVVNIASRRHTQCVKRRKSFTERAYISWRERERKTRERQKSNQIVAQNFCGCHHS